MAIFIQFESSFGCLSQAKSTFGQFITLLQIPIFVHQYESILTRSFTDIITMDGVTSENVSLFPHKDYFFCAHYVHTNTPNRREFHMPPIFVMLMQIYAFDINGIDSHIIPFEINPCCSHLHSICLAGLYTCLRRSYIPSMIAEMFLSCPNKITKPSPLLPTVLRSPGAKDGQTKLTVH